jgi:hypothetical protein
MLELQDLGVEIDIFELVDEHEAVMHPEAMSLAREPATEFFRRVSSSSDSPRMCPGILRK